MCVQTIFMARNFRSSVVYLTSGVNYVEGLIDQHNVFIPSWEDLLIIEWIDFYQPTDHTKCFGRFLLLDHFTETILSRKANAISSIYFNAYYILK